MQSHPIVSLFRITGILLIIFAVNTIGYYGYWMYLWTEDGKPCEHHSRIISQNRQGDRVEFAEDFCSGPDFSDAGTLNLLSKAGGDPQRFFFYQEHDSDPVVLWTGNDQLTVKIGRVDEIYVQKFTIEGVHIRYDIGEISTN